MEETEHHAGCVSRMPVERDERLAFWLYSSSSEKLQERFINEQTLAVPFNIATTDSNCSLYVVEIERNRDKGANNDYLSSIVRFLRFFDIPSQSSSSSLPPPQSPPSPPSPPLSFCSTRRRHRHRGRRLRLRLRVTTFLLGTIFITSCPYLTSSISLARSHEMVCDYLSFEILTLHHSYPFIKKIVYFLIHSKISKYIFIHFYGKTTRDKLANI